MAETNNNKDNLVTDILNDVCKCLDSILGCLGADGDRLECYTKRIKSNINKLQTITDYENRKDK